MTYELDSHELLVQVDRSRILDIAVGDTLEINGMSAPYSWTSQDQQLVESNPDADILLKMEKGESEGTYQPIGLVIREKA